MVRSAELAERLDVRLHTHFAENAEDDEFSLATFGCRPTDYLERTGWLTDRAWLAHCVMPDAGEVAPPRRGRRRRRPLPVEQPDPVVGHRAGRRPAARPGCTSGSASTARRRPTAASLWLEARQAMLLAKLRDGAGAGTARMALEMATLGGAACLGRTGELGVLAPGAVGDVAVWSLTGPAFAGAIADPIEAWLRCGPVAARDTIVARPGGRARRRARAPERSRSACAAHRQVAARMQG